MAQSGLLGPDGPEWMAKLDAEVDNFRTALGWSRAVPEGLEIGLRLCGALSWFWLLRGRLTEGRAWAHTLIELELERGPFGPDLQRARARAEHTAATLAWAQGDLAAESRHLEAEVAAWRALEDKTHLAAALAMLSCVQAYQGDVAASHQLIAEGHNLLSELSGPDASFERARFGYWEGRAQIALGNLDSAHACFEQGLAGADEMRNSQFREVVQVAMGDLAVAEGDDARAETLFQHSLAGMRSMYGGSERDLALILVHLGLARLRSGDLDHAEQQLQEALQRWREQGVRAGVGLAVRGLGGIAAARGEPERGGLLCGASANLLLPTDPLLAEAHGAALAAEQCLDEARARASAAFEAGSTAGVALDESDVLNLIFRPAQRSRAVEPVRSPTPTPR